VVCGYPHFFSLDEVDEFRLKQAVDAHFDRPEGGEEEEREEQRTKNHEIHLFSG